MENLLDAFFSLGFDSEQTLVFRGLLLICPLEKKLSKECLKVSVAF